MEQDTIIRSQVPFPAEWNNQIHQELADSALMELSRTAPVLNFTDAGSQLLAQQDRNEEYLLLLAADQEAGDCSEPAVAADCTAEALDRCCTALTELGRISARRHGRGTLCLAEGRITMPSGKQAPVLLQPIRLRKQDGDWQMIPDCMGRVRNEALLDELPEEAPAEGWSLNREPLFRQLDRLLEGHEGWALDSGACIGFFPLWLPVAAQIAAVPLDGDSVGAALLAEKPDFPAVDPAATEGEEYLLTPLDLNADQLTALRTLGQGGSLRILGGHGTGKTQLLAALAANAAAAGQHLLLITPREADGEDLVRRMRSIGLGRQCLRIPAGGNRLQSVLHQFNRALLDNENPSAEDFFSVSQLATQQGAQLDHHVQALHRPCRCGLSPFRLICRYLETEDACSGTPIPVSLLKQLGKQEFQAALQCIDDLTEAADGVVQPADHPLSMVWGWTYEEERAQQLPALANTLLTAISDLERTAQPWAKFSAMDPPSTYGDWKQAEQIAARLTQWEQFPESWGKSSRIPMLSDTVKELRSGYETLLSLHETISADWEDDVLALDGVTLEKQWNYLQSDWKLPDTQERETQLKKLLASAEQLLSVLEPIGRRWGRVVHIDVPTTRDSWERSYEVALELSRWKDIPPEWGSCAGLTALLWDVGELIDHGRKASESKAVLLRDWEPEFLTLDGSELLDRWQKELGTLGIGWLKRQSELRTELEPYCKIKMTAEVLENGLHWLVDLQEERSACDQIYHRWEKELVSVYQGEDTVWAWLESARHTAEESHDWLTELTGSNDFLLKYGSSPEAVNIADQLQSAWEQARETLGRLDVMIGRTSQPDSPNWLEERQNDCRRLRNLLNIRHRLEERCKKPLTLGDIAPALHLFSQFSAVRTAFETTYSRWAEELDPLCSGDSTDWDALLSLSLQAVEADEELEQLTGDLEFRVRLTGSREGLELCKALSSGFDRVLAAAEAFSQAAQAALSSERQPWLPLMRENTASILNHLDQLKAWNHWRSVCRSAENCGLGVFVEHYDCPTPDGENTRVLFRRSLYFAVLRMELDWLPQLGQFSSRHMRELLQGYELTEERLTRLMRQEILHLAAGRRPDLLRNPDLQEELDILRWANNSTGHDVTLDSLLQSLPLLTKHLFSCIAAGPQDLLSCFPQWGRAAFDYVAIDGAARLSAPVGTMMLGLGKAAVLLSDGADDPEAVPADMRTLWEAAAAMPLLKFTRCCLCHPSALLEPEQARTDMLLYPMPYRSASCMAFKTVVGSMDGAVNPSEVTAVTAEALHLYQQGKSFAVFAPSAPQAELIRLSVHAAIRETDPLHQHPMPAIADFSDLPGGRWDTVLFSMTVSPDSSGSLRPAAQLLRSCRAADTLPAALCKARKNVLFFSCLEAGDLDGLAADAPLTASVLRTAITQELSAPQPEEAADRIAAEIGHFLSNAGYVVRYHDSELALSVARPQAPDTAVLGIFLDNEAYADILRPKERELAQFIMLKRQGWNLFPVWTVDWLLRRSRVEAQLTALLVSEEEEELSPVSRPQPAAKPAAPSPRQLYTPAHLLVMGIRDNEVSNPSFQNRIYRVIEQILEQESPISVPQLTDRMLLAFGLDNRDAELREHCASLWRKLGLRITREKELAFVWMPGQDPDRCCTYRVSAEGEHYRSPEDVSCQECANAVCAVLQRAVTLSRPELARAVAAELGYKSSDSAAQACALRGMECAILQSRAYETVFGSIAIV